jgi:predicted DNA-binding transcriptional regulator YafY
VGHSPQKVRRIPGKSPAGNGGKRRDADRRLRQSVRFARILRLLELLQGRDRHDTVSLANELEVSRRTVLRDIDVLRLSGVGLDYDPSGKSYVLHGDYQFAVAGLTDDELLGQATAAALTSAKGLDVGEGAGPTARKIRTTGRGSSQMLLEDALRVTAVLDLKLADHGGHRETIRTIQLALVEQFALEGSYASPYRPGEKQLILHPIRLCLVKQAWYLIARPDGTDDPVTYRVTRFRSLRKLLLRSDVPEEFDLRAYFGYAWGVYRGDRSYDVEVRFMPETAPLVTETTWHHTQQTRWNDDGSVTLSFRVDGLEEIVWWVLGWSGRVEILRPAELRALYLSQLKKAVAMNGGRKTDNFRASHRAPPGSHEGDGSGYGLQTQPGEGESRDS